MVNGTTDTRNDRIEVRSGCGTERERAAAQSAGETDIPARRIPCFRHCPCQTHCAGDRPSVGPRSNAFLAESDAYVTHMFNGPMDVMWVSCLAGYRIADAKSTTASAVFPMDADNPRMRIGVSP